jgi:hypothetical protein
MKPFLFRCPITGQMVQAVHPDDETESEAEDAFVALECLACSHVHLVNPSTGKVAGAPSDDE